MQRVRLEAGDATVEIDVALGSRLASLCVGGHELLVTGADDPLNWGCYPMVPWAGRVADGRFDLDGTTHQLPIGLAPHAIHGTAYLRPWRQTSAGCFELDLSDDWPFGGTVTHTVVVTAEKMTLTLEVMAADQPMPAMAGWHPWFRRSVAGSTAELRFEAGAMYERDSRHLPTGRLVAPTPRPWDDCFRDVKVGPALHWPGVTTIHLASSCDHWVVYDEPEHAICIEPQTGPPDQFNSDRHMIGPGEVLRATFTVGWTTA